MTGSDQIQSVFLWNREEVALLEAIMRTNSRAELHARVAEPDYSTPDTYQGLRSGSRTIKSSGPFELYKNRLVSREGYRRLHYLVKGYFVDV